jgi:hypothetical protein
MRQKSWVFPHGRPEENALALPAAVGAPRGRAVAGERRPTISYVKTVA